MSRSDIVTLAQVVHVLLHADEKMTEEEQSFFDKLLEQLAFTDEERAQATTILSTDEAEAAVKELPYALRKGQLEALIEGSLVDSELDGRERAFVERIAAALQIEKETLDWLWEKMSRQMNFEG